MENATPTAPAIPAVRPPLHPLLARWKTLPWARLGIVGLAAGLRLWMLDLRPSHFDEGVNGWFTDQMQKIGCYRYDPTNYHGPLHFYILFVFKCLFGRNLWALRLPVALAGALTIDWIFRFERFFGRRVVVWTALALAVSPAYLFYHRYAIHETWLVFFMVLGGWGMLGMWFEGARRYLWAVGMGITGMILTKETYLIHLGCLLLACLCALALERWPFPSRVGMARRNGVGWSLLGDGSVEQHWRWRDLAAVFAVSLGAILFFYSGNGFYPKGLEGLLTTFTSWGHKANEGEGHIKPFVYWSLVLWRNEPWAAAGAALGLRYVLLPSEFGWPMRIVAVYALGTLLAYSLIPYKTPWCVLAFAWPFFFVTAAAIAEAANCRKFFVGWLAAGVGAGLLVYSGWLALRLNFYHYTDESENYVYVHTYEQVAEITGPLYALAREDPANYHRQGLVLCDSTHPLPWLLGDFSRVGYYSGENRPADFRADFLIVTEDRIAEVEADLDGDFFKTTLRLRPSLAPVTLYLRYSVFSHLMPEREPEFRKEPSSGA